MSEEQQEFVFHEWIGQAKDGLAVLRQRKEDLEKERERIETSLAETTREISALETMLSAHGELKALEPKEEKPRSPRVAGIQKVLETIAKELTIGVDWPEEDIITMVVQDLPGAKNSSIQGAIRTLAKRGVFKREMVNGKFVCSTTIGKTPPVDPPPVETPPETKETSLEEQVFEEELAKTVDVADVVKAIEKEMKKRQTFTIADKNIKSIAETLGCVPKMVKEALKVLTATEQFEIAYEGDSKVLRHRAEPGSKEELKRTPIKDKPLFPEADRPQHA